MNHHMWLSKFYLIIWVHLASLLYSQWFACKAYDTYKYVWIQYFKLLFKLNEQTAQWIICHAWNLFFIHYWKKSSCNCNAPLQLSGIIKSIIRSNIYMIMFLTHQNDKSGTFYSWLTLLESHHLSTESQKWISPLIVDTHDYLLTSVI